MNNFTTIAALPQGGGCMSALPAEKNEAKLTFPPIDSGLIDEPKVPESVTPEEFGRRYLAACQGAA